MATAAVNMDYSRGFSVGRVFSRAFGAIGRNPVVTIGIAFLLGALPALGFNLFMRTYLAGTPKTPSSDMNLGIGVTMVFAWLASMAIGVVVQAALTRATVADSDGRRASLGECVMTGVRLILPLAGLFMLWALGVGLGMVLLLVPGIIVMVMWSVAVPSLVEERQGVFASFARSRALTKGERWKIFGILIILLVAFWLLSIVLGVAGVSSLKVSGQAGAAQELTTGIMLLSLIPSTVFSLGWGTIQAGLYVELRNAHDGGTVDHLQDVFA